MSARFAALVAVVLAVPSFTHAAQDVAVKVTFNVTPNAAWAPGEQVNLSMDARRSAELGKEDIFFRKVFPGSYPRTAGQQFDIALTGVKPNQTIILQGYMCSASTGDCYPSDGDNPPSCSVTIRINPPWTASCQPVFTYTGGGSNGGVTCTTECR